MGRIDVRMIARTDGERFTSAGPRPAQTQDRPSQILTIASTMPMSAAVQVITTLSSAAPSSRARERVVMLASRAANAAWRSGIERP